MIKKALSDGPIIFWSQYNTTPDPATFPLWLLDLVLPSAAQAASITYVKSPIPIHSYPDLFIDRYRD